MNNKRKGNLYSPSFSKKPFMRQLFLLFSCIPFWINAQQITIQFSEETIFTQQEICVQVAADVFENMGSLQFQMEWNAEIIELDTVVLIGLAAAGGNPVFNETMDGMLLFSWFNGEQGGSTLPPESILFELCFTAIGQPGQISTVGFSNTGISAEAGQFVNGIPSQIDINSMTGFVQIIDFPEVQISTTDETCQGGNNGTIQININPPDNLMYELSINDDEFNFDDEFLIENLLSAEYVVVVYFGNLTLADTIVLINDSDEVPFQITAQSTLNCLQNEGMISVETTNGTTPFSFEWAHDNNLNAAEATNLTEGDYPLTIIDDMGCFLDTSFNIQAVFPMVDLGEDATFCQGETVLLDAEMDGLTYLWSTGETTSQIEVSTSDEYTISVTDENDCTDLDSINIVFTLGINGEIIAPDSVCANQEVTLFASDGIFYSWLDENENLIATTDSLDVSISESTQYTLVIEDECSADTVTKDLIVITTDFTFPKDTAVFVNTPLTLEGQGGVNYEWAGEYDFSCLNCPETSFTADSSRVIYLTITDKNGCSKTDSILVEAFDDIIKLFAPINVITPNGDGKNDLLVFKGLEVYPKNTLKIFNRWGNIVYETIGYQNDWGGTFKDERLPAGNYYYVLRVNTTEQVLKSILTISDK